MFETTKITDLCEIVGGFAFPSGSMATKPTKHQVVKMANLYMGELDLDRNPSFVEKIDARHEKFRIQDGDILITLTGTLGKRDFGYSSIVFGKENLFLNQRICLLRAKRNVDPWFLYYTVQSEEFLRRFFDLSIGGTGNQANVSIRKLGEIEANTPSPKIQRKVAEILRTWDDALDKLTALRTAKEDRVTGLTHQIMGRGGVFPKQWPLKALSDVSKQVRRKSAGDNHPVMTISAKSGFLMQSDKFARDMAGRSVERYTLLHEGEFAYNKGNSKTAPYGCVFRLERSTALVPFVYYCFALKPGLDPEFYEHLFAAGTLNHQLSRLINSGVRNDGLLNLYSDDFYGCRVPVPPIDEQRQIARTLTVAKKELSLLDEQIEALTRQKRGLMQKLLTGEWRVKT